MSDPLKTLYQLHQVDERIHRAKHGLAALEKPPPIAEQLQRVVNELAKQEARLQKAQIAQRNAELEVKTLEARRDADRKKLYGGKVVATRELQALEHEIQNLEGLISASEEKVLEAMEAIEPVQAGVKKLQDYKRAAEARLASDRQKQEVERKRLQADLATAEPLRDPATHDVDPALLRTYEQIRARRGHPGLAVVENASCGQCHNSVPSMVMQRLRDGQVVQCDTCNRIYYYPHAASAD